PPRYTRRQRDMIGSAEMYMMINVTREREVTPELLSALRSLIHQLNFQLPEADRPNLDDAQVARTVANPDAGLLIARTDEGQIVGTTRLVIFDTPTGRRAWIEDVVVDGSVRGQGVGELLVKAAISHAEAAGADHVDLTSAPYREAANRLYPRVG